MPDLARPWLPFGDIGVRIDYNEYVTSVDPGSPAATAGIHIGDRFDPSDFYTRIVAGWSSTLAATAAPGQRYVFVIDRGQHARKVTIVSTAEHPTTIVLTLGMLDNITGIAMVLIGLALVLLRQGPMTWGFYLFTLGPLSPISQVRFDASLSPAGMIADIAVYFFLFFAGSFGLAIFALRFPRDELTGFGRAVQRIYFAAAVPVAVAMLYYIVVFPLYGITGGRVVDALANIVIAVSYLTGLIGIVHTYLHTRSEDRQKIRWVIAGFGIGIAGSITGNLLGDPNLPWTSPLWLIGVLDLVPGLIPLTVAYSVIRHRVVDVRFAVSRALVLATLTAIVIVAFSLLDWVFSKALSNARLGTVAEILAAIALGFWLNALHGRIDRFVDAMFFRRRRIAQLRLNRVTKGLTHAMTARAVDEAVVCEPVEAYELTSGAIFVADASGRFIRRTAIGWSDETQSVFDQDDRLLMHLRGADGPVRLDTVGSIDVRLPHGEHRPVIAVPLLARHRLIATALFGAHRSGADLDADELKAIADLSSAAAYAYEHIDAEELRERVGELTLALSARPL
ncbi:MAG TPA: hypothetical protein VEJ20_00640 [Candidatus Eremiobacteraceae bacterium]|nr:hypothetical protein [Candidatus Eremiobacteraceae bacterium]